MCLLYMHLYVFCATYMPTFTHSTMHTNSRVCLHKKASLSYPVMQKNSWFYVLNACYTFINLHIYRVMALTSDVAAQSSVTTAIVPQRSLAYFSELDPADNSKFIEARVYRKWTAAKIPSLIPTGFSCILIDKKVRNTLQGCHFYTNIQKQYRHFYDRA